jgi:hypothetical protein
MDVQEGWQKDVDWMHPVQESDQLLDLVNTVMNLWFHKRQGISWLAE